MKGVRKFYHYSKSISKILRTKFLSDNSFSKTNTYDLVLEVCPEVLLGKKEIAKFRKNRPRKRKSYESKYSHVDLKFKNRLLQEFFSHNRYVLGFDEKLSKGWIKSGMFQLLANRIGNRYFEFGIDEETAKNSFVLEQKYWSPKWSLKKFKVNSWNKDFKIWEHPKIVKEVFGKYYLSIKRLSDYKKGEFRVPEFWIYGKILTANCKRGQVPKSLINKYILEGKEMKK